MSRRKRRRRSRLVASQLELCVYVCVRGRYWRGAQVDRCCWCFKLTAGPKKKLGQSGLVAIVDKAEGPCVQEGTGDSRSTPASPYIEPCINTNELRARLVCLSVSTKNSRVRVGLRHKAVSSLGLRVHACQVSVCFLFRELNTPAPPSEIPYGREVPFLPDLASFRSAVRHSGLYSSTRELLPANRRRRGVLPNCTHPFLARSHGAATRQ